MLCSGGMISTADHPGQIGIAIAGAMAVHNAAYVNCNILHGNITDRAILFQKTADGVTGVLVQFDYATYVGDNARAANREVSELKLFQSIVSLDHAEVPRTRLNDWESLLYVIYWLGTFGINKADQDAFVNEAKEERLDIKQWLSRYYPSTRTWSTSLEVFNHYTASRIRHELLRQLAKDIHKALFCHEGCSGTYRQLDKNHRECGPHPLIERNAFEGEIVAELLQVVARHKQAALVAMSEEHSLAEMQSAEQVNDSNE
ncbi:hypothetical protein GGI21_001149 [Coemansia aciculifera]|nr:hypothetical protein GGI21_001149 [Coemansia aciculifera]